MKEEVKVYVIDKGRTNLYLRYTDPLNGKVHEKSAKTREKKAATKAAGAWEDKLRSGRYQKPSRMTWEAFREHYATHALPALAETSIGTYEGTLNVFGRLCNPQKLSDVTTARVTAFVTALRGDARSEATILAIYAI